MFSQTTIYSENFSSSTFTRTGDWIVSTNAIVYPACNVVGTSAGNKLIGQSASTTGSFEAAGSPAINTSTFVNVQVSWNMIRGTASSPAVTFQWSNDAGSSWNTLSYTAPTVGSWGAVGPISLPAAANATVIYVRWTYSSAGGFGLNYVGLDDVNVSGTPSPSYYWNGSGALHQVSSWGTNTNGTGANPPDFTTANQNFYLRNGATPALTAAWTVSGVNSVLNVGDGTAPNATNLTIPSSFALTISGGAKLNVTNSSTLTIANTTFPSSSDVVLGTSSTINYAQTGNVQIWGGLTYGNLIFSGSGTRDQPSDNVAVQGQFTIGSNNSYVMSNGIGLSTQLSGPITCNGNITGGVSNLTIDGSGTIGTITFSSTSTTINNLVLNRASQTLALGSNLTVLGIGAQASVFTNGSLSINGRSLTISGPITFPASTSNGVFIGSATSSLTIDGSGAITNNLLMDQTSGTTRTLNQFTMNRASTTLTLGNDLVLSSVATFSMGSISLNGMALTLDGVITFPTSASNGSFIGSTTSSLSITGVVSGAISNSLFMSQSSNATKSLGLFSNTRGGSTIVLGNDLIVTGTAAISFGILDLNGTHLTLSGPITFPTNASRNIRGSLTSSITINGSGTITNSMFMNQSNSTSRSLSALTMNRSGQTLTLGNLLETYGTVFPTLGTIDLGSNNLFIRSNATSKGGIGPVVGSLSGTARVETFAPGGSTNWAYLGVSGISGQTFANWDGQIPMSCVGCINGPNTVGSASFVSIQGWNETAATSNPNAQYPDLSASTGITPGVGYWVYLGNAYPSTSDITWTVSGSPVTGTQPLNLTYSGASNGDGWNLVANPYPSPISWASALASNPGSGSFMDDSYFVYSADYSVTASYNNGVSSPAAVGLTDNIPMGQGFAISAFGAGTFNIFETNKVAASTSLYREANAGTVVRLNINGGGYKDEAAIRFHSDAAAAYDRLDARKMYSDPGYVGSVGASKRTTIATVADGVDYSINSLPNAISADAVIPVMVKVKATGQHTISGTDLQNLPNSCTILKDKLLNVEHDLKSGPYVCTIADTTSAPRFELRVCADAAMSVNEAKNSASQLVTISNDVNGIYITSAYDKAVKSTISVTNILGQKIVDSKTVNLSKDKIYIDVPEKNQVIFVTVRSENGQVTKKMIR